VVFAVLFAQVSLYPGVDTLVAALGARGALGGSTWFLGVELVASVAFAWGWGAASDARGARVPLVRVAALVAAGSYVALAVVARTGLQFPVALAVRAAQGAATVGVLSLAMAALVDLPGGYGRNMGAAGVGIGAGPALGAPVGGLLYEAGPLAPLAAAAALSVLVAALVGRVDDRVPAPDGRERGVAAVVARLRDTPGLVVPYAFGFVDRLTAGVFSLAGTLYFRTALGLSPTATGLLLAAFFAPFALLQYPFGALSDRLGRAVPVVVGSVGYGVGVAAVGVAPSVAWVGAAMVAVGVVGAFMSPATAALVTDLAADGDRGVVVAGFNAAASVGFLAGVVLAGSVAGVVGFAGVFLAAGAVEVALAAVAAPAVLRLAPAPE
jgi:MFS family permease